ncbi:Bax inhibitor-1 family protein [Sporomusa aerivorans]|uniref:Bax inhibitor-1 family protein n=1 Tax=Sporomusa aerivorans TaxID=204936 RepID=UPI00352A2981
MKTRKWGNILFMALIGLIIASLVNMFLKSYAMMWVLTYVGVLIFVGLTAYDTQQLKKMAYSLEDNEEMVGKFNASLDIRTKHGSCPLVSLENVR